MTLISHFRQPDLNVISSLRTKKGCVQDHCCMAKLKWPFHTLEPTQDSCVLKTLACTTS